MIYWVFLFVLGITQPAFGSNALKSIFSKCESSDSILKDLQTLSENLSSWAVENRSLVEGYSLSKSDEGKLLLIFQPQLLTEKSFLQEEYRRSLPLLGKLIAELQKDQMDPLALMAAKRAWSGQIKIFFEGDFDSFPSAYRQFNLCVGLLARSHR